MLLMIKASDDFKSLLNDVKNYTDYKLRFEALGAGEIEYYKAVLELARVLLGLIDSKEADVYIKTQLEQAYDEYEATEIEDSDE